MIQQEPITGDPSKAFIQIGHVSKLFRTPAGDFVALKDVSAGFYAGEFISIVGKSGSGKSTLVNMLTGIDRPTSGQVWIGGTYVHKLNESQMARWRGRNLGIVFQFFQLLPTLSLLENTMLPMDFSNMVPPGEREGRAMALLDMVGLSDVAHEMPSAVSGGQQQCAAVARALANDPPLIVADEPTGNLDSRAAERVFDILTELARRGKTVVMVTHDNSLADRASRKVILSDGEVIDDVIARTLPLLTHRQMLKATKELRSRSFAPGEMIIRQGDPIDAFYMIADGYTDVIIERPQGTGVSVAQLGPGQHFGEIELLRKSTRAVASIKAALHSAVKVISLDREVFVALMTEAHAMREGLWRTMQERLRENAQARGRNQWYAQTALA